MNFRDCLDLLINGAVAIVGAALLVCVGAVALRGVIWFCSAVFS